MLNPEQDCMKIDVKIPITETYYKTLFDNIEKSDQQRNQYVTTECCHEMIP